MCSQSAGKHVVAHGRRVARVIRGDTLITSVLRPDVVRTTRCLRICREGRVVRRPERLLVALKRTVLIRGFSGLRGRRSGPMRSLPEKPFWAAFVARRGCIMIAGWG